MFSVEQIANYRNDLEVGLRVAPDNEKTLYNVHLETLGALMRSLEAGETIEVIAAQVRRIRRDHGWSYLVGEPGERATSSAHKLLSELENQIIEIKGRNWYYDEQWRKSSRFHS
jgi:hypothetical protein